MTPSYVQLPRAWDLTPEDMSNVALTPIQRAYVETRQAMAIHAIAHMDADMKDPFEFIKARSYHVGVRDLCEQLLSIQVIQHKE